VLSGYTKIVNAIREADPVTPIMLEPNYGAERYTAADFAALTAPRDNLLWSIHDYYNGDCGDGFSPDGTTIERCGLAGGDRGYNPSARSVQGMERHLRVQRDVAREQGLAMWVGEFGIGRGRRCHDRFIADKVAVFDRLNIGHAWWEYYSGDGVFSMTAGDSGRFEKWVDLLVTKPNSSPAC
jgi:hypothetical protein